VAGTWSGFTYHGARYYAPWLGRWMSADPIGLGDGTNVYAYVRGNPVTYVDPGGMEGVLAGAREKFKKEIDWAIYLATPSKLPAVEPAAVEPATSKGDTGDYIPGKPGSNLQDLTRLAADNPGKLVKATGPIRGSEDRPSEDFGLSGWVRGEALGQSAIRTRSEDATGYSREVAATTKTELRNQSTLADVAVSAEEVASGRGFWNKLSALGSLAAAVLPRPSGSRRASKGVAGFGNLSRAADFGVKPYAEMTKALKGTGLQAHHAIEQRFAGLFGGNARQGLSVAVTPAEHQVFTNRWRELIPYGPSGTGAATRESVMSAARKVYADHPDILRALGL
jgi:hypothetical protein